MKPTTFLLAALVLCFATVFAQSVHAQVTKKKPKLITKAEYDKRAVKRFVASFIKALDETKDLNEVSSNFFVKDFKTRFIKECLASDVESAIYNKLDEAERYELNATFFNIGYLGLIHAFGKINIEKFGETGEENDIESVNNVFPAQIIGLIKNSKILNAYFLETEDEDGFRIEFEIKDIEVLREFITDSKNLVYAQRMFLNDRPSEQITKYDKTIKELRKEGNWYSVENCRKECPGFPENTQIFNLRYYPLSLLSGIRIARKNSAS